MGQHIHFLAAILIWTTGAKPGFAIESSESRKEPGRLVSTEGSRNDPVRHAAGPEARLQCSGEDILRKCEIALC